MDWDWVMAYMRAINAYAMLTSAGNSTEPNNIYNAKAKEQLARYVLRDMANGKLPADAAGGISFDYTQGGRSDWRAWLARSFQYHTVRYGFPDDGLQAALGGFSLRCLAKGRMEPHSGGGNTFIVTGVSVFVEDRFTFQAEDKDNFYWWSCERKMFINDPVDAADALMNASDLTHLYGEHFLRFQNRHNCGNDFITLTEPHAVENFQGMRYVAA